MNPDQREAAERLADELAEVHPLHPYVHMCGSAAALLRELLAEPRETDSTGAMASAWFGTTGAEKAVEAVFGRAEPQGEPVAWIHRAQYLLAHAENSPPADWMLANGWGPLYAHPPQQSQCAGKKHDGCNYLAKCGTVCNKCGRVV